jgi:hypothetical protein
MTQTLRLPSPNEIRNAIIRVGGGMLSESWVESAIEAVDMFTVGSVATQPYGLIPMRLQVAWGIDVDGLSVTVSREP